MAVPVTPNQAVDLYTSLRQNAMAVRNYCLLVQNGASGSGASAENVLMLLSTSQGALGVYAEIGGATTALATAIQAYVQQVYGNTGLSVITDAQTSASALQALIAAILKDLPVDSAGHLLTQTLSAAGAVASVSFTSAQLPNTLPAITNWLATIT